MQEEKSMRLTTTAGAPVADNQNSLTAGPRGLVLLQDVHNVHFPVNLNPEPAEEPIAGD